MNAKAIALAFLCLASPLLAGCTGKEPLPDLSSTIKLVIDSKSKDYHWPELLVTNAEGKPATLDTRDWPHAVEQMVPLEGSSPTLAIDGKGTLFMTTFDKLESSSDQGRSWSVVNQFESINVPDWPDRALTLGATQWVDPSTDAIFLAHLNTGIPTPVGTVSACPQLERSTDGGHTWKNTTLASWPLSCVTPTSGWGRTGPPQVFTAKPGPKALPPPPTKNYPNVLYYCHVMFVVALTVPQCWMSYDAGDTFVEGGVMGLGSQAACITWSMGRPDAFEDGTVVVPLYGLNTVERVACPPRVAVSADNGMTWAVQDMPLGPHIGSIEPNPQVAITSDGTAYFVYRDTMKGVYTVRSTDRFGTWQGPFRVGPASHTLEVQPTVVAGGPGRVAFGYLGTSSVQDSAGFGTDVNSEWHMFLSTSFNAGEAAPIFVTQQVTPREDPVQIGCIAPGGGSPTAVEFSCLNLGFQMNGRRDAQGRVVVAFVDGCTPRNDCTRDAGSAGFQGRERNAAVAVVDSGWGLFAEKGLLSSYGLRHPDLAPKES